NEAMAQRANELAPMAKIDVVGNGADMHSFAPFGPTREHGKYLLYAGTASEWQGAGIFIDAFEKLLYETPDLNLVFIGQGSEWKMLQERAKRLPLGRVQFYPSIPPDEVAAWFRGAIASVAS